MSHFIRICFLLLLLNLLVSCKDQPAKNVQPEILTARDTTVPVGGGCDGCELMYVDMPTVLASVDTNEGWYIEGQKLIITGTVFKRDSITPAANVIIYYWHTDQDGNYTAAPGIKQKAAQHGNLRGWVRTNEQGAYSIYTLKPAPYPDDVFPAHIHFSIKEPEVENEYYPDDLVFANDPFLKSYFKKYPPKNRCGSGVVKTTKKGNVILVKRDFILGLNIPDYPEKL